MTAVQRSTPKGDTKEMGDSQFPIMTKGGVTGKILYTKSKNFNKAGRGRGKYCTI
jgi:hypothetical protein